MIQAKGIRQQILPKIMKSIRRGRSRKGKKGFPPDSFCLLEDVVLYCRWP